MPLNTRQTNQKPVTVQYIPLQEWGKGLFTRFDRDRIPLDGLSTSENLRLSQNGTFGPRPGTRLYGTYQPIGIVLGEVFEFVRVESGLPITYNIWAENRNGMGTVLVNKDGGTPITVTGKNYAVTAPFHFSQGNNRVNITNGVDYLSYMDISTFTITAFASISTPTSTSATASSALSGTTYVLRYRVAASGSVGETPASAAQTVSVAKLREAWNGSTEYVTFTWNRITTGVMPTRYNIYVGDQAGNEYYLDSVADAGTGTTQSYVDNGSIQTNSLRIAPAGDSTSGPRFTRTTNIKGQIYGVGDTDNPERIWFDGGSTQSNLDFSSFNGGGWVAPNKGGKDFPVRVIAFRDGKGTPMAACLSQGTNGSGKRYLLSPATTTLGSTTISYMSVVEDNGQDGTDAPDSVVFLNDALFYLSRSGIKTSRTSPNIQNIISTSGISDNISTVIQGLNYRVLNKAVSAVNDQVIYFSFANQSSTNNVMYIADLRQQGAWMGPWEIAADWLWQYGDNTQGKSLMLGLVANQFVQFDDTVNTNDVGKVFQTNAASGDITFGKNGESSSIIDVTFEFQNPQGPINLSVNLSTEDGLLPFNETMKNNSNQIATAWGREGWGGAGWGEVVPTLLTVNAASQLKQWVIDTGGEVCNRFTWGINTTGIGVDYELTRVIIRHVPVGFLQVDNAS